MASKIKPVLKKHKKLECIYHPESFLVFKSSAELVVVGRIENDELIPLDQTAIEQCEKFNFEPDPTLFSEEAEDMEKTKESEEEPVKPIPKEEPIKPIPKPLSPPKEEPKQVNNDQKIVDDITSYIGTLRKELQEKNTHIQALESTKQILEKDLALTKQKLKQVLLATANEL